MGPDILSDLLGDIGSAVTSAFADMEIAEEELERVMSFEDSKRCFLQMRRPEVLRGKADFLYRAHVVELCERFGSGETPQAPTDAEMLMTLVQTSLAAPLNQQGRAVYQALFESCARRGRSEEALAMARENAWPEPWQGSIQEMIALVRDRYRCEAGRSKWGEAEI